MRICALPASRDALHSVVLMFVRYNNSGGGHGMATPERTLDTAATAGRSVGGAVVGLLAAVA